MTYLSCTVTASLSQLVTLKIKKNLLTKVSHSEHEIYSLT